MHLSEVINKNIVRIRKIQSALIYETDSTKRDRLSSILGKIKKRQLELVKLELKAGGPFKKPLL